MNDTDLAFHVFGQTGSYDPVLSRPDAPRLTHEGRLREGRYPRLLLRWRPMPELLQLIAVGGQTFAAPGDESREMSEQIVLTVAQSCFRSGQEACALLLRRSDETGILEGTDDTARGPQDDPAFDAYRQTLMGRWRRNRQWMLTRSDWESLPQEAFLHGWSAAFRSAPAQ